MRVLISAESFLPRSNGVTNSVLHLCRYLRSHGHHILIVASGDGPSEVGEIPVLRVPALALKTIAQVDIPRVRTRTLVPILRDFRPDIVYLASPFLLGEQVRKAAVRCGIPVVANYQTDVSGFIDFYGLANSKAIVEKRLRKIHQGSTLNVAPSTASIEFLKALNIPNIRHWGRGVDLQKFNPSWRSAKLRKSWGADADTIVIGFVGRLAPEKQVHKVGSLGDVGILAGKKIIQVIVGEGPTRKSLEKTLPKAIFTGHLSGDDLSRAMASMDVLVTTGENETFCQVIQEAMASKLAVVAPNVGGPVDLIEDGIDGALYQPGENLDIRKKVLLAISDSEKLSAIADAGYKRVQSKTWESICEELFAIFTEVVRNDRIARSAEKRAS